MAQTIDDLVSDFEFIEEWEDRYKHIIDIGRALPPMAEALKTADSKVSGCASQVWIVSEVKGNSLTLVGDSDALIVKGLIAVAFMMLAPLTLRQIVEYDALAQFKRLGLKDHLSQQRANGLASMIKRIKLDAEAALLDGNHP